MLGNLNHPSAGASERLRRGFCGFQGVPVEIHTAVWPGRSRPGQRTLGNAKPLAANTGRGGVSAQLSLLSTGVLPGGQLRGVLRGAGAFSNLWSV